MLQQEQEEYQREGIQWQHVDYFNNKVICDLVDMPHKVGKVLFIESVLLISTKIKQNLKR